MNNRRRPPGIESYRPGSDAAGPPGPPYASPRPGPPPRGRRPAPRRKPQRRRSSGIGSVILYLALGLVVLIVAGMAFLIVAPPTDFIRDQLVAQVKANTGRNLTISGRTGLSFYPGLGLSMSGVTLSPPPGMQGPPFARMKSLTIEVKLLPLLSRTISVKRFVLQEPVFDLRVDKNGRKSWDFASASAASRHIELAQAEGASMNDAAAYSSPGQGRQVSGGGTDIASLEQLELGDVRIVDGKIRYIDATSATHENVDKINVTLALKSIASPLQANGDLRYKGQKVDFKAVLQSLKQILGNKPAKLNANVESAALAASYKGTIDVAGDLALDGDVSATSQSIRALARWFGTQLPPAKGFGPLKFNGRLKANGPVYKLANADLAIDGASGTGDVTVDTSGERPRIAGDINLSELDLNKYLPPSNAASGGRAKKAKAKGGGNAGAGKAAATRQAADPIGDLIERPGPRVKGYAKRAGWSKEPIDVSPLSLLDANVNLTLGKLLYENIKVGRSRINVALADRSLQAKLSEMQLYEGSGRGVFTLNARNATPQLGANFNLNGISAQPLLNDAADIDWLAGNGQLLLAVKSAGISQKAIVSQLNGTLRFTFNEGAVVGVNVPKAVRAIQQGRFTDLQGESNEKTDFTTLKGSFNIRKGVATNKDLEMLSPLLRVTGEGRVMLPGRRIDYTVKPKLVASLAGQGGKTGLSGIEIPVRISGPFEDLNYKPQLDGVLKDPGKAADTLRELGRQYGGEETNKALDKLLGGNGGDTKSNAKKLLDGFLGGR